MNTNLGAPETAQEAVPLRFVYMQRDYAIPADQFTAYEIRHIKLDGQTLLRIHNPFGVQLRTNHRLICRRQCILRPAVICHRPGTEFKGGVYDLRKS